MKTLSNLIYGLILKNSRKRNNLTQEDLVRKSFICLKKISHIENGRLRPKAGCRHALANALSDPLLEYFPSYSIEEFGERLEKRFEAEIEAVPYFLDSLGEDDLDNIQRIFQEYQSAAEREDHTLMLLLDEYIHTRLMNAHPDLYQRNLSGRYRQDFIEFFKLWIPLLDLNITRQLEPLHFKIFEAVIEQDMEGLQAAISLHLDNSIGDVEQVTGQLTQAWGSWLQRCLDDEQDNEYEVATHLDFLPQSMNVLPEDDYTKLAYGIILRQARKLRSLTQQELSEAAGISLRKVSAIENGHDRPKLKHRQALACALSDPLLEYFPEYSIEQFDERLGIRFQIEMEAVSYFINRLTESDLGNIRRIFYEYTAAAERGDHTLMILLDEYIHARLVNAHPNPALRNLATRYRQDFMGFFKLWVPLLNLNIIRNLEELHFQIFEAVLARSEADLSGAIRLHVDNSCEDVRQIRGQLGDE